MAMKVAASEFKAKCLRLLDEVAKTGETIVVTKRGKPVARIIPPEAPPSLEGSVSYLVSPEELIKPLPVRWNAESE